MSKYSLFSLAAASMVSHAFAAIQNDFVPSMPGYSQLPSKWYSGYLDIPGGKHIHYLFVESMNSPATDPVHLW